jgi:radical SAM superfamily enzyme YgiQ (UPF0313 family)
LKVLFILQDIEYIDPMGVMLLSALAKEKGHQTFLHVLSGGNLIESIENIKPDVVAFASTKTGEHKYYLQANADIKKNFKGLITVMGGPHPTFFPEIIEKEDIDAICVGEGYDAWPELLDAIENKGDINNIPNIVTRENRKKNPVPVLRQKRRDMDSLPFLDRELIYKNTRLGRFPMRSFMVGRGCPFYCTYCFNHIYNTIYKGLGPVYVRMSVNRVIAELKDLKNRYETQFIKFYDDIFVFRDDEWLDEFTERYPKEIGLPFHCLTRADLLTEPILLKLKKAGLRSISMSIEAGNTFLREQVLKRKMTEDDIIKAFDLCYKHNIPTFCNTILAIPGGSIKEDIESLDINLRCRVTFGEFPIFFPYPKTELAKYAMDNGYFDGDFDKLHASYQSKSPLDCFSEREKLMQINLSLLATICLWQPWLRNITVKWLIKLPLTGLYFIAYYLVKAYLVKTKIYPMRFSLSNTLRGIYESFILEKFKHFREHRGQKDSC